MPDEGLPLRFADWFAGRGWTVRDHQLAMVAKGREDADVLLVESTYGDRMHPQEDDGATLARVVTETHARGGKVIIPAFAIGRVEELLYWLFRLEDDGRRWPCRSRRRSRPADRFRPAPSTPAPS